MVTDTRDRILALITKYPGLTTEQIRERIRTKTVGEHLRVLIKQDLVRRESADAVYTKSTMYVYYPKDR
jgi:predicted ArsR family transcriptional regulator